MFKGFAAAQSRYDNMMPDDDEDKTIEQCLEDMGYNYEKISCGITVLTGGHIEFFGTEEEVFEWLEKQGEI